MRRLPLFALLSLASALAGCALVFGIEGGRYAPDGGGADAADADAGAAPDVQDAQPADAPAPDSGPDACTPVAQTPILTIADTTLLDVGANCDPSVRYGGAPILNLGLVAGGAPSIIILRFDLGAVAARITANDPTLSFKIVLSHLDMHAACGGPCPYAMGTVQLYPMTNNWEEGTSAMYSGAGWCQRNTVKQTWATNGAGGSERGALVGFATMGASPPASVEVPITPSDVANLKPWLSGTQLAVAVVPQNGARAVFGSKENGAPTTATLVPSFCP